MTAMGPVKRTRRRTGATDWQLLPDGEDPTRSSSCSRCPPWDAHARQHGGRLTGSDVEAEQAAHALAIEVGDVRHYFPADAVPDDLIAGGGASIPAEPPR